MNPILDFRRLPIRAAAVLLLIGLAGCGTDESDLTVPAVGYSGTTPVTTERTRYLAGTVEAGAELTVTVGTDAEVLDLAVADGRWACRVENLEDGGNFMAVQAVDEYGNQQTINFSLQYDALSFETYVSPLAEPALEVGGLVDPDAAASLVVTAPEGAVVETLAVDGDHWRASLSGLATGNNQVVASIEHPVLGTIEKTLTVNVNAAAPEVRIAPVTSPADEAAQTVTGSRSPGLEITVAAPTAEVGTVEETESGLGWNVLLEALNPGKNVFTASARDGDVTTTARSLIVYLPGDVVADRFPAPETTAEARTPVQAVFGAPMQAVTIDQASFVLTGPGGPVAGEVSYDASLRTATLRPAAPLAAGTYTATLTTAVTTAEGDSLPADQAWNFTVL